MYVNQRSIVFGTWILELAGLLPKFRLCCLLAGHLELQSKRWAPVVLRLKSRDISTYRPSLLWGLKEVTCLQSTWEPIWQVGHRHWQSKVHVAKTSLLAV